MQCKDGASAFKVLFGTFWILFGVFVLGGSIRYSAGEVERVFCSGADGALTFEVLFWYFWGTFWYFCAWVLSGTVQMRSSRFFAPVQMGL